MRYYNVSKILILTDINRSMVSVIIMAYNLSANRKDWVPSVGTYNELVTMMII